MLINELEMSVKVNTRKLERSMKRLEKLTLKADKAMQKFNKTFKEVKKRGIIEIEIVESKLSKQQRLKTFDNEIVLNKKDFEENFISVKALKCCETIEQVKFLLENSKLIEKEAENE